MAYIKKIYKHFFKNFYKKINKNKYKMQILEYNIYYINVIAIQNIILIVQIPFKSIKTKTCY